jgi:hypothetical protein
MLRPAATAAPPQPLGKPLRTSRGGFTWYIV